jgi:hypothetical protein
MKSRCPYSISIDAEEDETSGFESNNLLVVKVKLLKLISKYSLYHSLFCAISIPNNDE